MPQRHEDFGEQVLVKPSQFLRLEHGRTVSVPLRMGREEMLGGAAERHGYRCRLPTESHERRCRGRVRACFTSG